MTQTEMLQNKAELSTLYGRALFYAADIAYVNRNVPYVRRSNIFNSLMKVGISLIKQTDASPENMYIPLM